MRFEPLSRRQFIQAASAWSLGAALGARLGRAGEATPSVTLPFENGQRDLVAYPQKRPLIRLSSRPPQLETPFTVFNEGILTPNDAFFVRYHLSGLPTSIDPSQHRIRIRGLVRTELSLSVADLKQLGDPVDVVAVNQCSGNSRGFSSPRVPGGQLANGAMGNARWTGVPLKRILERAGVAPAAKQVTFRGLDKPVLEATPAFVKALDIDHALDGEVMVAWAMNGEDIPMLNGFPMKLVVPGYYGTYWIKHLSDIEVVGTTFDGFWMSTAYRLPDNPTHSVEPGQKPAKTVPISRLNVRSFITSVGDGARVATGVSLPLRGIAFDGGSGIRQVMFSEDGGRSWRETSLSQDLGRYSFREWRTEFTPRNPGSYDLRVRAVNGRGETQPEKAPWNPSGYMRNAIESLTVLAT